MIPLSLSLAHFLSFSRLFSFPIASLPLVSLVALAHSPPPGAAHTLANPTVPIRTRRAPSPSSLVFDSSHWFRVHFSLLLHGILLSSRRGPQPPRLHQRQPRSGRHRPT